MREDASLPRASVLIIDLDNTIFDWFALWQATFTPIYEGLVGRLGLDTTTVESKIRDVHQKRKTSEYTFLIDEIDVQIPDGLPPREFFAEEIRKSKAERDRVLRLYPSVLRTLWEVKSRGSVIVAYTESLSFYSAYRLKRLGLDGVVDYLYSPKDHDLPAGLSLSQVRTHPDEHYELQVTEIRHTPADEIKPNPKVLKDIIKELGATPSDCVYIGDTLFKDVAMAQDAGVHDVYAEYGAAQGQVGYELLRRVSHWSDKDVERERAVSRKDVKPTRTVEFFGEILRHFDFIEFRKPSGRYEIGHVIDIWKKIVDVQQHFNQIEMQIRNFALTVVGAILAAGGVTFRDDLSVSLFGTDVRVAVGLAAIALAVWAGFWFMDRHWYHRLLKGAVTQATSIETRFSSLMPEIALGTAISAASPINIWKVSLSSSRKIDLFYFIGAIVIILFGSFAFIVDIHHPSPAADAVQAATQSTTPDTPPAQESQQSSPGN